MTAETSKIKAKLANLNASLGELESLLQPLLAQSLPETLAGLEPIQQAKLQTILPYITYDLVFIYLKAKGIDPKTHPVVSELDRVRQYFEKIAAAEKPPIKRTEVDKDAANRFIKHAISQAQAIVKPNDDVSSPTSSSVPVKVTTKMIARAQYERTLEKERQEQGEEEEEEEELQVYDEPNSTHSSGEERSFDQVTNTPAKAAPSLSPPPKRRRPATDPFAGYGEEINPTDQSISSKRQKIDSTNVSDVASAIPNSQKAKKKKKSKK